MIISLHSFMIPNSSFITNSQTLTVTPHITERKAELREAMLERIRRMNDESRAAESRSIVRRILELLPKDRAVCAFSPLKTEPDLRPLLSELMKRNQPFYLPIFNQHGMVFCRTTDLNTLVVSSIGIPEPPSSAPLLAMTEPVTVLVPGRAFDVRGARLGRGNGGYDRWIRVHRKENGQSRYFGIAFDCQIVHDVPMEEHDARVDAVITGRGELAIS